MIRRAFAAIVLELLAISLGSAQEPAKADSPPDIAALVRQLTDGAPNERAAALGQAAAQLSKQPAILLPAVIECARASDPRVRAEALRMIGQQLIWVDGPQNEAAIAFALEMSREADPDVVHACVYFCLSTVREKSKPIVDRLIELACEYEPASRRDFARVVAGLAGQQELAAKRIQTYLDRQADHAKMAPILAAELFYQVTGGVPDRLERFAEQGEFFVILGITYPFQPKSREEVAQLLRQEIGGDTTAIDIRGGVGREGGFALVLVKGIGPWLRVLSMIDSTDGMKKIEGARITPEIRPNVERLVERQAEMSDVPPPTTSYEAAFKELYDQVGREYPNFALKEIDWQQVGAKLLPESQKPLTTIEFGLLCQRLVARLEDSHAVVTKGTAQLVSMPMPRWDPGFACLIDQQDRPVIYSVRPASPAAKVGLQPGTTIVSINGVPVAAAMDAYASTLREYFGYSSDRVVRYDAARGFQRQRRRGTPVKLEVETVDGARSSVEVAATLEAAYVPRLPVLIDGINDSANVSFKRLDGQIGYIYVRRISQNLIESLDQAVAELHDCQGLILDVRGNSGGGFDAERAFHNFDLADQAEPERPRFRGPIAVLIDARCISAGEGWISWFRAKNRARFFGETTAGASASKKTIDVAGGLFKVTYPVKAYTGFLDRPIERLGIAPDVPVRPSAKDLSQGLDSVLETARSSLADSK